jgi:hypothetical protein
MNSKARFRWGWCRDPYGLHEERYISGEGSPTKLVRDAGSESYDPPPEVIIPDLSEAGPEAPPCFAGPLPAAKIGVTPPLSVGASGLRHQVSLR